MRPARALRGPTLLSAQRAAGSLTAACAFAACAASGELGAALTWGFLPALLAAHRFGDRAAQKRPWVWTALLGGALVVFGAQVWVGQLDIVLGAARFVVLLVVHRLWNRAGQRDELLVLLLSLLLLCAGAALSAELLFGVAFLGYAVAGTWALALTHLRFEIEAGRGPEGSAALLQSRRVATPALLGGLALLSLVGVLCAAAVFALFPRVTLGGLRRASGHEPVAGLGDQINLSGHGTIGDDPRVVLRVRYPGQNDTGPKNLGQHWRARSLEVWTGNGWRARPTVPVPGLLPQRRWSAADLRRRDARSLVQIEAVGGFSEGVVVTPPGWTLSVRFLEPASARGQTHVVLHDQTGDLFYTPTDVGDHLYEVATDTKEPPSALLRSASQDYPPSLAADLEVPDDLSPRVRALSGRLAAGKNPADAAHAVEQWLSGNLRYSRTLDDAGQDPIDHFLFERREGHCELFSSAMVLLLRAAGIPARNVTGYYGGTLTRAGYRVLRAGDAHSWVEVYFPGVGFVSYDPTPPDSRGASEGGLWESAVLAWDALAQRWRSFVVDYDLLDQGRALQQAGRALQSITQRFGGTGARGHMDAFAAARSLGLLGIAALALWLGLRLRKRQRARTAGVLSPDQRRAQRLWRDARAALRREGSALASARTPREAALRAAREAPGLAGALGELGEAAAAARWGGGALSPSAARAMLGRVRASLRRDAAGR